MNYEMYLAIATEAHAGQTRRGGAPYIEHPIRVAEFFESDASRTVAVLHDVLEDTPLTGRDLLNKGVDPATVSAVESLTHLRTQPYAEYIELISDFPFSTRIKVADILDNLMDNPTKNQKKKYKEALKVLLEL